MSFIPNRSHSKEHKKNKKMQTIFFRIIFLIIGFGLWFYFAPMLDENGRLLFNGLKRMLSCVLTIVGIIFVVLAFMAKNINLSKIEIVKKEIDQEKLD